MKNLWTSWQWQPWTIGLIGLIFLLYLRSGVFRSLKQLAPFLVAMLLLGLCLLSPLQLLSAQYLFSIHMAVHVVLLLIIAPLLVLALPEQLPKPLAAVATVLRAYPWLGWFIGVGIMWFWHIPGIFNSMMRHDGAWHTTIHAVETVSLLLSGMLFSYPVIGHSSSLHPLAGIVYLSSACVCCSFLGLMITFAPVGLYYHYLAAYDPYGLNNIIQYRWGISQAGDQEAAGLIMWVPCCMIYVVGCLYLLKNWFEEKEYRSAIKTFTKKSTL